MAGGTLPSRIGRYEIAGRLAMGGMAEVLLGRLRGPHGFDRPVVIKRILPHLLAQPEIVDMFLTEARTIANIRHPNLIQVHELGRDGGELFMVMEYLEGESVAGLCRRLAVRSENLDFALAAHLIAEACAGLHAAHEAVGSDKRPLEIVHRDISPQNLFVSYSGAVHVIDFGIARTARGVRHTETGSVRGKVEYLAPEQLGHAVLDRRVDIFALGIVLFELATGRRLFRRASQAEVMAAILRDPIPSLLSLHPGAPPELDAICARALSKDVNGRFQTALEMRRALLAFTRKRAGDDDLDEKLARCMQRLFADRAHEKADMLERARISEAKLALPAAEVDVVVELPSVVGAFGVSVDPHATETAMALAAVAAPPPPSGSTTTAVISTSTTEAMMSPASSLAATLLSPNMPFPVARTTGASGVVPTLASAKDNVAPPPSPPQQAQSPPSRGTSPFVWAAMIVLLAAGLPLMIWTSTRHHDVASNEKTRAVEAPPAASASASGSTTASTATTTSSSTSSELLPSKAIEPAPASGSASSAVRSIAVDDAGAPSESSRPKPATRPTTRATQTRPAPSIW